MRKLLIALVASATLVACGGGDDEGDADSAEGSATTASTSAEGSTTTATAPPTGDPNAITETTGASVPSVPTDTTPIDPATVETLPPPADPGPPPDPGFLPAETGRYTYRTTGTSSVAGGPVDRTSDTVVTSLGPNEIRYAASDQVLDLQYRADGIYVRQLVMSVATTQIRFQSANGVLFAPNPHNTGHRWQWQLTDTTGGLSAAWDATAVPSQSISVAGADVETNVVDATITLSGTYAGFPVAGTMRLTMWIDPARRLPVQLHQVLNVTSPFPANVDTTSTLTGFTPG